MSQQKLSESWLPRDMPLLSQSAMNYLHYYSLEDYLFTEVTKSFRDRGYLTPEEFFSIVIWKANRSKGRIKAKLTKGRRDLDTAVKDLTTQIHQAASDEERLRIFLSKDWAFGLAMATAVLTVLYPDRFTVYDIRVRGQLNIKDFARPVRPDRNIFQTVPAEGRRHSRSKDAPRQRPLPLGQIRLRRPTSIPPKTLKNHAPPLQSSLRIAQINTQIPTHTVVDSRPGGRSAKLTGSLTRG
jgi:hypothetical protein